MSKVIEHAPAPRNLLYRIGIPHKLIFGFIGFTCFMLGDGVELGYLANYLTTHGIAQASVTKLFTIYGISACISSWLSGALSDAIGPQKVMIAGLVIWLGLDIPFLFYGVGPLNTNAMLLFYGLRGFGYPLFAYGFLCWVVAATPGPRMSTAVGWYWFFSTLGLLTFAPLVAKTAIPKIGEIGTFWLAFGVVAAGGLIALLGLREPTGRKRLAKTDDSPVLTLLHSVTLFWREPRASVGAVIRMVNTMSLYAFMPIMPGVYTSQGGFVLGDWLQLLSIIFAANIASNLICGILGDRIGHRRTIAFFGALCCAVSTPLFYYLPLWFPGNFAIVAANGIVWGIGLAGYLPIAALMALINPERKGAMLAAVSLGAGVSMWFGPLMFTLFEGSVGKGGVCIIFSLLYLASIPALALLKPRQTENADARIASLDPVLTS